MTFSFRRLNLASKLSILVGFPIILCLIILAYFFRDSNAIIENSQLVIPVLFFIVTYAFVAIYFVRKLAADVKVIERVSSGLASGNQALNGQTGDLPEAQKIVNAIRKVQDDLQLKTDFAEQLRTGNLGAAYNIRHEYDSLGKALLSIKDNLVNIKQEDQHRNWAADGLAKFVQILQTANNLKDLSNEIIVNLVRMINANQGAIFILVEEDNHHEVLEMQACYAFNRSKHLTQKIAPGEGLIGQAFLERQTVYLKDVPEQFVRITSGLGEANPRYVLIVPLKMNETIVGMVELASFSSFNPHVIDFVEKIGESIAHSVSSFRTAENTKRMLEESRIHAEEMRAHEEELRQNQEELQATQEAISRKYETLFRQVGELHHQSKFDQLKSITSTKKHNVEYYFDIIRNQILTFSENLMVVEAVKDFKNAFYKIDVDLPPAELQTIQDSVSNYYTTEFITRLNDNIDRASKATDYIPTDERTLLFQYHYISNNPHPTGSKSLLDAASVDNDYSKVHAKYHPIFRSFLEKFGYYDIFLIDAVTGDMLYSVFKEVDFATNLHHGLYGNTNFGKVVKMASESPSRNFVRLIDFEPYDPSYYAPASFIATAIYDGEEKIGILVFQMPINKINQILTGNNKWTDDGLGVTGETFIVGSDYKLRSISRQVIEDLDGHLRALKKIRYDTGLIQQILKMQTNILMEEIKTSGVGNALKGMTGTSLERNAFDESMLCAYAPLNIPDVRWIIMSTMNEDEANERIENLKESSDRF